MATPLLLLLSPNDDTPSETGDHLSGCTLMWCRTRSSGESEAYSGGGEVV